jgi:hypothetical protein
MPPLKGFINSLRTKRIKPPNTRVIIEDDEECPSGRLGAESAERSINSACDSIADQSPASQTPEGVTPPPPVPAEPTLRPVGRRDPNMQTEDLGDGVPRWVTRHPADPTIFHRHGHAVAYKKSSAEDGHGVDVYVFGGKHPQSGLLSDDIFYFDQGSAGPERN